MKKESEKNDKKMKKESEKNDKNKKKRPKKHKKGKIIVLLLSLLLLLIITSIILSIIINGPLTVTKGSLSYTEFMQDVSNNKIDSISITGGKRMNIVYKEGQGLEEKLDADGNKVEYKLVDGKRSETLLDIKSDTFLEEMSAKGITIQYEDLNSSISILLLLLINLPTFAILGVIVFIIYTTLGPSIKISGNVKADIPKTLFEDIAGMKEEKEELLFAINSLKNIESFTAKGIKPISGILLEGPPGVGKTLLAKAVAGEAGVNFLSYSGSDFVELYVGLGAARVRGMYKKAQELKPCVVFIDEIDALGRKRLNGGGNQEADQTLVALLERMDGMNTTGGILFIGATNRIDTLDSALLRPGRFDKIIHIGPPKTKEDREAIVKVHSKDKSFSEDTAIPKIAKQCYGLTGAEIAAVLNDAVLESFKDNRDGIISLDDIDKAVMKLISKGLAKGRHSEEDRYRVAVHEVGHALMNLESGREVVKVSIQPYSSGIGGITMIDGDSKGVDGLRKASDLKNDIKVLYAGKVAEEVILGEGSVGASNDLERATYLIRDYVGAYGLQEGTILSLVGLAKENGLIAANEELLHKMEKEGQILYNEVSEYFMQDKVKKNLHNIVEKLIEEEVIYNITDFITE